MKSFVCTLLLCFCNINQAYPQSVASEMNLMNAVKCSPLAITRVNMYEKFSKLANADTEVGALNLAKLAGLYYRAIGVEINVEKAFELASKAVINDRTGIAHYELAILNGMEPLNDSDKAKEHYRKALSLMQKPENSDDGFVLYKQAYILENELTNQKTDPNIVNSLRKKAAELGYYQAMWVYAASLESQGLLLEAAELLCQGALMGISDNMLELANFYSRLAENESISSTENRQFLNKQYSSWYKLHAQYSYDFSDLLNAAQLIQNERLHQHDYELAADLYKRVILLSSNEEYVNTAKYLLGMLKLYNLLENDTGQSARDLFHESAASETRAKNILRFYDSK